MGWVAPTNERKVQTVQLTVWHTTKQLPTTGADYTSALVTGGGQ